jgi:hypothetical protein
MKRSLTDKSKKCLLYFLLAFSLLSCTTKTKTQEQEVKKEIPKEQIDTVKKDNDKYLKEQDLISYIPTAGMVKPKKRNGKPFGPLDYDKVIAYDFDGCEEPYGSVITKEKFVLVILKQQFLTQKQADKILSALTKVSTYGGVTASCFNPHFALLFFKNNKITHKIDICLDCNYLFSDIAIPAETVLQIHIGDSSHYPAIGFSKRGRKAIIDLCKEINFYYANEQLERI